MPHRYARQEALWGTAAQARVRASTIAVVGAGGLGSPALLYLAGAGIGKIVLFDDDVVSLSNLHRQVIHTTPGEPKAASAARAIAALNPAVNVECHGRLEPSGLELVRGADLILDGTDNFPARHLCSWIAHELGIPHVWASILGFDAQLSVFWSGHGPVYEDVFPTAPAGVPSCSQAGVLGPVVGVVGSATALEALKLVAGLGSQLLGQLGYYDGLAGTWEYIPLTGRSAIPTPPAALPEVRTIPPGYRVFDVRTLAERAKKLIPGSEHLPDLDSYSHPGPAVLYCASGIRSLGAVEILRTRGFAQVYSLRGGLAAWEENYDKMV